jgi:ABC-type molybdate transport system substrate-binding protein
VFPTIELDDTFDFSFQPDRMKDRCHYIFHAKNPVNGLVYGHRAVILYHKFLCLLTSNPYLDFTLSQAHTVVPQLCGISHFNQTPEISWRVAFREVLKLCDMKPTVESKHRLKKWCELGKGQYADYVQKGALDAVNYYEENIGNKDALLYSYELDWLKEKFNATS